MRKAITFLLFFTASASSFAFDYPKEFYLSYKFNVGEKLKEIAESFNVPLDLFIAANQLFLTNGAKTGEQLKLPMIGITTIIGTLNGEDYRLLWIENAPTAENQTENLPENLRISVESINNGLLNMLNQRNLDRLKIDFGKDKSLELFDPTQIKLMLQSLQRINFVRANTYMTLNRI